MEGGGEINTQTLKVMLGDRIRDDLLSFLLTNSSYIHRNSYKILFIDLEVLI